MIKKIYPILRMAMVMILTIVVSGMLFSCTSEGDEPDNEQGLNVYPWKDHPKSYIRLFDNRMEFRILSVLRNGPALQVEYTLTNVHFGEDVTFSFYLNSDGAHDDMGNTYKSTDVIASINGGKVGTSSASSQTVTFKPNQTIKGGFTIRNFDRDATAFSLSFNVINRSSNIVIADERLDFVNIPVAKGESLDVYPWTDHPESYIRMFDYRFDFKMLSVKRNGSMLEIEYSLTNTGFNQDVTLSFYLDNDAGHDNLGNTYSQGSNSNVIAYINGGRYYHSSASSQTVTFKPNQTIRGYFAIRNFNKNATAFSIDVNVINRTSDFILATDRLEFVNIPVPEGESLEVYPWTGHPESYISKFDSRFDFKMLSVKRNDTELEIEYSLANVGFNQDVTLSFYLDNDAGHDNLGNTYSQGSNSNVIAYINGGRYYFSSASSQTVTFKPDQYITGSFTIKNFNKDATSFSIDVNIINRTSNLILATDKLEFVNIPVPE